MACVLLLHATLITAYIVQSKNQHILVGNRADLLYLLDDESPEEAQKARREEHSQRPKQN